MAEGSPNDIITLESMDGQKFPVTRKVFSKCEVVCTMLENVGGDATDLTVPFNEISGPILKMIVEWLTHHAEDPEVSGDPEAKTEISEWDKDFLNVEQNIIFKIMTAANFLNVETLLDMCCKTIASKIKGKTVEQIRQEFNIKNDFTPEEEKEVRETNAWCEED